MKRTIAWLLCAIMVLCLCACGSSVTVTGSGEEEAANVVADLSQLKTMGDALAIGEDSQYMSTWNEESYIYCFMFGDTPVRVVADLDAEMYAKVDEVVFSGAEDAEDQLVALLSPLPLSSVEDLSEGVMSAKDLGKLSGKTGQELLDDGWLANGSYWSDDDALVVLMDKGDFSYEVAFDSDVEQGDDFDAEEAIRDLTVASVEFFGLGDNCTEIEPAE